MARFYAAILLEFDADNSTDAKRFIDDVVFNTENHHERLKRALEVGIEHYDYADAHGSN